MCYFSKYRACENRQDLINYILLKIKIESFSIFRLMFYQLNKMTVNGNLRNINIETRLT